MVRSAHPGRPLRRLLARSREQSRPETVRPCLSGLGRDWRGFLARTLDQRWRNYRKRLKRCQGEFSAKSVHDLRISLRRLLALLAALQAGQSSHGLDRLRRRLKKQLRRLSRLRDAQVQLELLEDLHSAFPALQAYSDQLRRRERKLVRQTRLRFKRLKAKSLSSKVMALAEYDDVENLQLAARLSKALRAGFDRVQERRRRLSVQRPATVHRLRLAFKRLRYLLETLQPALPKLNEAFLRTMQAFQVRMGEIQDLDVLWLDLRRYVRRADASVQRSFRPIFRVLDRRLARRMSAFLQAVKFLDRIADLLNDASPRQPSNQPQKLPYENLYP